VQGETPGQHWAPDPTASPDAAPALPVAAAFRTRTCSVNKNPENANKNPRTD